MSGPLTDEQIAEIKTRIERGREGIVFPWGLTIERMAALLAEVDRLKAENERLREGPDYAALHSLLAEFRDSPSTDNELTDMVMTLWTGEPS